MTRTMQKKSSIALVLSVLIFMAMLLCDLLGYKFVAKILLFILLIVFFAAYFLTAKFVSKINIKALNRYKNKKNIFTNSLLDDEEEPESMGAKSIDRD